MTKLAYFVALCSRLVVSLLVTCEIGSKKLNDPQQIPKFPNGLTDLEIEFCMSP